MGKLFKIPYSVLVICIDYLIIHFGYFSTLPIFAILLTQKDYTVDQVAIAAFVFIAALRSGRFFLGPFLDGIQPKTIIITGVFFAGFSFLLIGFVNSYPLLLLCLCLIGLGQSANGLAGKSVLSTLGSRDGNALHYFSTLNVFVNISAVFGPLFGTYLLTNGYQDHVFQITGAFYVFTGIIILFLFRKVDISESQAAGFSFFKRYKTVLTDRKYVQFLFVNAVGWFCYAQLFMALPYFVSLRYGLENKMGLLYALNAVLIIAFQMIVSSLIKKYLPAGKENTLLLFAYMLFGLSFLSATAYPSFYVLFGTVILFTLAEMIFTPSVDTIVSNLAKSDQRMTYFSFLGLSTAIGEGLGSFVGLKILDFWNTRGHFELFWASIAMIAGIACVLLWMMTLRRASHVAKDHVKSMEQ